MHFRNVSISSHRKGNYQLQAAREMLNSTSDYISAPPFIRTLDSRVEYYVLLVAVGGQITLPRMGNIRLITGSGINDAVVELVATLSNANSILSDILFVPAEAGVYDPMLYASIQVGVTDLETGLSAEEKFIAIELSPLLVAPEIHVMGEVFAREGKPLRDHPTLVEITPLQVNEDENSPLLGLYLSSVTEGNFTHRLLLSAGNGIFLSTDVLTRQALVYQQSSSQITLYGDLIYLNNILSTLFYRPNQNYFGPDAVFISACVGFSRLISGSVCVNRTIPIVVNPVNDAPELSITSPASILQDTALMLGSLVELTDVDSMAVVLSVYVDIGAISIGNAPVPGLLFLNGSTGKTGSYLKFSSSLVVASQVLESLLFLPPTGFNSKDQRSVVSVHFCAENDDAVPMLSSTAKLVIVVKKTLDSNPFLRLPGAVYRQFPCNSNGFSQSAEGHIASATCESILSVSPFTVVQLMQTIIPGVEFQFLDNITSHLDIFQLFLEADIGTVSLPAGPLFGLRVISSPLGTLLLIGTTDQLNSALRSVTYESSATFVFTDSVSFAVRNVAVSSVSSWSNWTLPIAIQRQTLLSIVVSPESNLDVLEDQAVAIEGLALRFTDLENENPFDADFARRQSQEIHISFSALHGYLLLGLEGLNVTITPPNITELSSMYYDNVLRYSDPTQSVYLWLQTFKLEGTFNQINLALKSALYRPALNWNSKLKSSVTFDVLNFTASLASSSSPSSPPGSASTTTLITVRVHPANDAPVITAAGQFFMQTLTEDMLSFRSDGIDPLFLTMNTELTISGTAVRDVDLSNEDIITLSLVAENGVVSILNVLNASLISFSRPLVSMGVFFITGTGTNDSVVQFRAPLGIANEAISRLTFAPTLNYYGLGGKLGLTVSDLGGKGAGGRKEDRISWIIGVAQKNLAPVISSPADTGGAPLFTTNEGSFVRLTGVLREMPVPVVNVDLGFELNLYLEPSSYSAGSWGPGRLEFNSKTFYDMYPGNGSSHPTFFMPYKNAIYFQANDGVHGAELWRLEEYHRISSEPPSLSPTIFADLYPGPIGSSPAFMTVHNGYLFFSSSGDDTSWMVVPGHRGNNLNIISLTAYP